MDLSRIIHDVIIRLPPMISSREIRLVRQFQYETQFGTMFWVDNGSIGRWVTAKHLVRNLRDGDKIEVRTDRESVPRSVKDVRFSSTGYDLAHFVIEDLDLGVGNTLIGHDAISQPVMFLGFPHRISGKALFGHPTPIVKSGVQAGIIDLPNEPTLLAIDGLNNPGFSGGPIFSNLGVSRTTRRASHFEPGIIGMLNAYRYEERQKGVVYGPDGATDYYVKFNSGIALATPIRAILDELDLIQQ